MARGKKKSAKPEPALGYEAKLWKMADALRNNMDAAEYKHVVLGLIFLKYISDAFEGKHAELALMNLAIRGIDARIAHGDTFHSDRHPDLNARFVPANPPFNDSVWRRELLSNDRECRYWGRIRGVIPRDPRSTRQSWQVTANSELSIGAT